MSEQDKPDDEEFRELVEEIAEEIGGTILSDVELAGFMEAGERAQAEHDAAARAEGRRFLDEERDRDVIAGWWEVAGRVKTIDEATHFARELVSVYRHDYGTICHAIASAAIAMANAVERSEEGGVTGFQAGVIGWQLHGKWMRWPQEPRKLVEFSHLLFPQHDDEFGRLSIEAAEWLQAKAREYLAQDRGSPRVRARWTDIAEGRWPSFVHVEIAPAMGAEES